MKRCRHVISMDSIKHRCDVVADGHRGPTATGRGCIQWKTCAKCHAWLPLGPARDDERTAVEVRAAEIAADWERFCDGWHGLVSLGSVSPNAEHVPILERSVDNAEAAGIDRAARIAMNERDLADYWTGWLAREIAEHEEAKHERLPDMVGDINSAIDLWDAAERRRGIR